MKGAYRALVWMLGTILLLGTYGCKDRDTRNDVPEPPRPDYRAVKVGKNEYDVEVFDDLPPSVYIENLSGTPVGVNVKLYARCEDRGNNARISEMKVYEDGNLIGTYRPDPRCGLDWAEADIPISHWTGGERTYHAEANDVIGQIEKSNEIKLIFAGHMIDTPPTIRFSMNDDGSVRFSPHDRGDNAGIESVTLIEDGNRPVYRDYGYGNDSYSTTFPLPAGRWGAHTYFFEAKDVGNNVSRSKVFTVNYRKPISSSVQVDFDNEPNVKTE